MNPIVITPHQLKEVGTEGVATEALDKSGLYNHFLMFPMATIRPGETHSFTGIPQVIFAPRRLVVAPDVAGAINVLDIKVGKNSMMLNGEDGAPGTAFPPLPRDATDTETMKRLEAMLVTYASTVFVCQAVTIRVRNLTNKTLDDVRLMMWGLIEENRG